MNRFTTSSVIRPFTAALQRSTVLQPTATRLLHHGGGSIRVFEIPTPTQSLLAVKAFRPIANSYLRNLSTTPHRPDSAYSWIDAEAEMLIARAYNRHKALADKSQSFPPSLSVAELEKIGKPFSKPPVDWVDKFAYNLNNVLKRFVHAFFREKYDHHAVCLETVAAVPGMVAAFHRHMRSLRRMKRDHGWIGALSEESENERMHLLIFMKTTQPTPLERGLVVIAQGAYLTFYSVMYFFLPRAAHRLTGYLEETAHEAYTDYLKAIDSGAIKNKPAPTIAKEYYRLPDTATMRDVILHVRADEACHRDFNHHLSDKYAAGDGDTFPTMMDPDLTDGQVEKLSQEHFYEKREEKAA